MFPNKYDNLGRFMVNIAQDPSLLREFKSEPTTVMAQAKLTSEEQAILLSRDPAQLAKALKPNEPREFIVIVIRAVEL